MMPGPPMNRLACYLLVILCTLPALAQDPPRLIVRGDDMGYSHGGNVALMQTYTEGIMTSVEVIVPSPWFPEAVEMLKEHPDLDVGIHLALSSEWDNIKWGPVSDAQSIRDENGYFFPMIFPNPNYPERALVQNDWTLEDVEKEFRAQIELGLKLIPRISHISGHMGCTFIGADVQGMVKNLVQEYGLDIMPQDYDVENVSYKGPKETSEEKIASFIAMLEGLESGKTYMHVEHPGLDSPELRAIHHVGYEDVAIDRQGVTDTWTDERVMAKIKELGIQLISYKDLIK